MKGRISARKKNRWLLRGVGDERVGEEKRASRWTERGRAVDFGDRRERKGMGRKRVKWKWKIKCRK